MYWSIALFLLFLSLPLQAQQAEVRGARIWTAPDQTRLVVDTNAKVSHRIFSLENPPRLVIDILDSRLADKLPILNESEPLLIGMRSGIREGDDLRLVLDLKQKVHAKSFILQPNDKYGYRLVVDLTPYDDGAARERSKDSKVHQSTSTPSRDIIIAIDAGHGGEDPGAIGAKGTREKDVTLQIARKLAGLVKKERGMRALLIRDGDYFISLRKRIDLARQNQADLFVSIHADAYQDRSVSGSSVYTLSQRGASSEAAKWLADKENNADLIGGIDLSENDSLLATVLLDMTQNATLEQSNLAAKRVLANLQKVGDVHKGSVQKAGFVVLKAPDIPSMLVETAFISNPEEEARLRSGNHQMRLAAAMLSGIKSYLANYAPPATKFTEGRSSEEGRRHVISPGDTLGRIAEQYHVSLTSLRNANSIEGDQIRVGQVLTIPES